LLPLHELDEHTQLRVEGLQLGVVPVHWLVLVLEHCTHLREVLSHAGAVPLQQVVPPPHTALAPPAQGRHAPPEQYCPLEQQLVVPHWLPLHEAQVPALQYWFELLQSELTMQDLASARWVQARATSTDREVSQRRNSIGGPTCKAAADRLHR
jgi:hypothetical protein